jgi:hypothetical protein
MGRSRRLIILLVLCSGLVGRPAETIILEPASKLSKQTWSATFGVPQPKSQLVQALLDMWPGLCRGGPQQGPLSPRGKNAVYFFLSALSPRVSGPAAACRPVSLWRSDA